MSCWDGMPPPSRDEDEYRDSDDADESWRGDQHLEDWPESLAGPEYWLYRKMDEEDDDAA
jgi:hypothetical protein